SARRRAALRCRADDPRPARRGTGARDDRQEPDCSLERMTPMPVSSDSPFFRLRFVIVNAFTGVNLLIGVLSLIAATTGSSATAAWGLLLCVLLDMCDGSLARRWRVVTAFGAQLDSLADMTSFIIAGAALTFYWARATAAFVPIVAICSLYALSGAI